MKRPHDHKGHFIPLDCPRLNCGNGSLQDEGDGIWRCDGLADPGRDDQPLDACDFTHVNGKPYETA